MRSSNTYPEDAFAGRWLLRCAIAGVVGACFAVSASALDPSRTVSQYVHDSWGTERGLPGGSITAIAQTSDGYLWIGTDKGLVRFDGFTFRQFERANPDSILIGPVRTLLVDASDRLWILLQNTQVLRYQNANFELIRGEAEHGTTALARGTSGAILLSSAAVGTFTYRDNRFRSLSSTALPHDAARVANSESPDHGAFSWFDRLTAPTSLVISMAQTHEGKIWLGTESRGLFYLQEGRVSSASNGRDDTKINCLLPLQNSELLVGTAKGVRRWNGTKLTVTGVPSFLLNLDVLSLLRDRNSNFWVGTSRGLFRYNANGVSLVNTAGPVHALFEDREGNIWIGRTRGLERLRDSAFVTYSLLNLKSQSMGPLHVDSDGRTWVAPIQGGLRWLKEQKSGVVTADGIADDVVYSITGAGKGDVWVGRQHGGLTHLLAAGNSFTARTYTRADGLAQNTVYAVYRSRDGTIWSGTLNHGLSGLRNGHFTNYTTKDGLAANTVSSIAEGPDGTMWFGTPNGVSAMSQQGWRTYTTTDGLPSGDVHCLLQDSTRTLWIGTADGLAYLSNGQVHVPRAGPESLRAAIFGIAEDKDGWLWIATGSKVLHLNRSSFVNDAMGDADVREYELADGLQSTEGVKRSRSVVSDSAGRIWFSLSRGVSVVNPSQITDNSVPALPRIKAIFADDNPVTLTASVRIPPSPRRITFEFTGLGLAVPGRIRFRYLLENFDRGWSQPVAAREAVYTNLGPGSYRFRLIASNSEGLWNGPETAIAVNVAPAYYQTYWFRLSCIAAFLGMLAAAYRLRLRQLSREFNVRLDERVAERTRIARDLHDTLLQGFQGVLLKFHAVTYMVTNRPAEAQQTLNTVIEQARKAIAEGRDAVEGLRPSTLDDNDLARAITMLGEELAAHPPGNHSPAFHVQVEGTPRELDPIVRDEVYRIASEALRNAFRHSHAPRIEVEIRYDPRQLRLRVRDDGKGIVQRILGGGGRAGHYGLPGMHERARLVGGTLAIWSERDSGTEAELIIPGSLAYAKSAGARRSMFRGISSLIKS